MTDSIADTVSWGTGALIGVGMASAVLKHVNRLGQPVRRKARRRRK